MNFESELIRRAFCYPQTVIDAACSGRTTVIQFLHRNGADVHAEHNRALLCAALRGHLDLVRYLTETSKTNDGLDLALMNAAQNGHVEIVKYLERQGGDVCAFGGNILGLAAENGQEVMVMFLLYRLVHCAKQEADRQEWMNTALSRAAKQGHVQVVKALIRHGADPRAKNYAAFEMARRNGHWRVGQCLILATKRLSGCIEARAD